MAAAVARILEDLRARGGLRGADVANIVDVSPPTVSRWTTGKGSPPLHTQTMIADLRYVVECLARGQRRRWLGMAAAVARILEDLRARGGLRGADVANIVDVSPPTVSRWTTGKGSPPLHTQTMIADLRYVVECLSDLYSPDETRLWLHTPHPLLGRERAVDLIHEGRTEEVLAAIERLEAGAYI